MRELCVWWIEDGDESFPEFHAATLDWIRSLGLNPDRMAPRAGVVRRDDEFVLLYDEAGPDGQIREDWDPLNWPPPSPPSARREQVVPANSWPDRRRFGVPLWSAGRIAHVRLQEVAV